MRNKDTGEFELVVGDRQLLSGFFIGVLLLAVVFALGYLLGQNSPKSPKLTTDTAANSTVTGQDARPQASTPTAQAPASDSTKAADAAAQSGQTADASQTATPPVEAPPQPTTQPARDPAAPAAQAAPAAASTPPPPSANDAPHTYWQVTASSRSSADTVLQLLLDKGMPASLRSGPKNLTLVWVGPYTDKASMAKARTQLEALGFPTVSKP